MNNVIVIAGPTGTGKSRLALALCKRFGGAIISADSRQVYIGADVGTNKMPLPRSNIVRLHKTTGLWLVNGIPIHGYDWVLPDEPFTVSHFIDHSLPIVTELLSQSVPVFIVGGTGFYIDALLGDCPYSQIPPQQAFRQRWQNATEEELINRLTERDADATARLKYADRHNKQRLIRYLEIASHSGSVSGATQYSPLKGSLSVLRVGLTADRSILYEKAGIWTQEVFEMGLESETRELVDRGYGDEKLLQGIVYRPVVDMIHKTLTGQEAKEVIWKQMRRYIRRQLTWFRRHPTMHWVDVSDPTFDFQVLNLVESYLKKSKSQIIT